MKKVNIFWWTMFFCFFSCFCLSGQNQTVKNNQVRIGIRSSITTNTGFNIHEFWLHPGREFEPNFEIRRRLNNKHCITLEYGRNQTDLTSFSLDDLPDTSLLGRSFRAIELGYGYSLSNKKRLEWTAGINAGYRFSAWEWYHLRYVQLAFDKLEFNEMRYHPNAFSLGLSTDLLFRLKWGIFLHGKVGYHRYFSEYAPNELRVVFGAGWEF